MSFAPIGKYQFASHEGPSMVMFFAEFITCDAAIKYLKIPKNTKNFTVNLNKAIAKFYKDKTKYPENEQLVFKVK